MQNDKIVDILFEVALAMYDGLDEPDDAFNYAFLVCLPKAANGHDSNGMPYYTPECTRPLSIVDASNRILASIFRLSIERAVKTGYLKRNRVFFLVASF